MDNPNQNSSVNPNPTSPFGGPIQTPSDLGNLPTPAQPEPTMTQPQPAPTEPGPTAPPFPPSPIPSWPPISEPTTPSIEPTPAQPEPNPAPVSTPSWPQDTTQTTPISAPPISGSIGPDLTSAWSPPASVQPEPAQAPIQSEPAPIQPEPTVSNPWSNPQPSINPMSSQQTSTWTPPAPSEPGSITQPGPAQTSTQPVPDLPLTGLASAQFEPAPPQAGPTPPPSGAEPTPTFSPPAANPTVGTSEPSSATSPLNNPWGTPSAPAQPSWMMDTQTANTPPSPTETAPTDLSHLISGNQQEPAAAMPTTENLVIPTAGVTPEVPNLSMETHTGIPKWLVGLGLGLLIMVLGASAYFILGIGQPSKETTSLPATTTPQTNQVKPPLPIATGSAQSSSAPAAGSANFGQIGGGGTTPSATSAADLIRQRQQGR